ncbi:papain-like cysteine protease family protein [Flavobacterium humi]|nr:papain-like cysteine protease family protein [Flavobacterium humi]
MQFQSQSNWCWAANAASISVFYNGGSTVTQCMVASFCLNRTDCCSTAASVCNVPYYLDRALKVVGSFKQVVNQPVGLPFIKAEIDGRCVIGARIGWQGGGGHFVTLFGYNDMTSNSFVYVADPIYGGSYCNLANFTSSYLNAGKWTDTYLTKGQSKMLHFNTLDENLIDRARKMVPLQLSDTFAHAKKQGKQPEMMGHDIYNIDMEQLKGNGQVILEKVGERLLDKDSSKGDTFLYEFDHSDEKTNLSRIVYGDNYADRYFDVFEALKKESLKKKEDFKVSAVRLPALKVDAVWLEGVGNTTEEWFIPLFANDFLNTNERYSKTEFYELLLKHAADTKFYDDDKLGG